MLKSLLLLLPAIVSCLLGLFVFRLVVDDGYGNPIVAKGKELQMVIILLIVSVNLALWFQYTKQRRLSD